MRYAAVPDLPPRCGSWVVVSKASGQAVGEFFDRGNVAYLWPEAGYEIVTVLDWLQRLNSERECYRSSRYDPARVTGRYVRYDSTGVWKVFETATGERGPGMGATLREYLTRNPGVKPGRDEGTVAWPIEKGPRR